MKDNKSIYGSFFVGDFEIALPIESVQEVVNYPENITPIPLAPHFFTGLFTLRGMVIPVVNLGELLGLGSSGEMNHKKVAITTYHDIKIGLVFDSTHEILKVSHDDFNQVSYQEGSSHPVIKNILKIGERLLQVIDIENLIKVEDIPHIMSSVRISHGVQKTDTKTEKKKQAISFLIGDKKLAFPMDDIFEIIKIPKMEKGYVNYPYSRGLINLRGMMIPVMDYGHFLNHALMEASDEKQIMILTLKDDFKVGIMVDAVESIVGYYESEVLTISNLDMNQHGFYTGMLPQNILLMKADLFLNHSEISQIIKGHAKLYQNVATKARRKNTAKETFISFKIKSEYCFPILDIREIIEFPKELTRPIGAPDYILGIYNLRGKAITLINLDEAGDYTQKKVIIMKNDDQYVGLVVDSIENIFSIYVEDKFPCPDLMQNNQNSRLKGLVREFVLLNDGATIKNKPLVVLEALKFFQPETYKVA
ncbi:chemotaxis protein CheW [Peredibacter starrii]|uniref:Chemotaxis protein CheW n=1 Tax=Peredibacter starrii TaxID=28202 RepID=A0AAX4HK44_9BACT|nr:chemotaxis protein CheW [Peredibacter starrii]WPU63613.1 chemotaxis protein CheW [Peredibacter starrii]